MTQPTGYRAFVHFYGRDHVDPLSQKVTGNAVPSGVSFAVTAEKTLQVNWGRVRDFVDMIDLDQGQIPPLSAFATREEIRAWAGKALEFHTRAFASALLALKEGRVEEIKE